MAEAWSCSRSVRCKLLGVVRGTESERRCVRTVKYDECGNCRQGYSSCLNSTTVSVTVACGEITTGRLCKMHTRYKYRPPSPSAHCFIDPLAPSIGPIVYVCSLRRSWARPAPYTSLGLTERCTCRCLPHVIFVPGVPCYFALRRLSKTTQYRIPYQAACTPLTVLPSQLDKLPSCSKSPVLAHGLTLGAKHKARTCPPAR